MLSATRIARRLTVLTPGRPAPSRGLFVGPRLVPRLGFRPSRLLPPRHSQAAGQLDWSDGEMLGSGQSVLAFLCTTACLSSAGSTGCTNNDGAAGGSGGGPTGSPMACGMGGAGTANISVVPPDVAQYLYDQLVKDNATQRRPIVLCGPSGVGKSYLIKRLRSRLPDQVGQVVSHTTRDPRDAEANGTHYHFVTKQQFQNMIRQGDFVEYDNIHGNMYGTSYDAIATVHRRNQTCLLDMTVAGAKEFVEACSIWQNKIGVPAPWVAYIRPPSMEELERWLRSRKSEDEASLERRLVQAADELQRIDDLDIFDKIITKAWVD